MSFETKLLDAARQHIAELEHRHKNDDCANHLLLGEITRIREKTIMECAALFQGGTRNREMYLNDIEERILGLLPSTCKTYGKHGGIRCEKEG